MLLFMTVLALVGSPSTSSGFTVDLDPTTYNSRSGEYSLWVDPSARDGSGAGEHRLSREGVELWSMRLPFTFWNAAVADNGIVVGYGYTHGERDRDGKGDLVVAIISASGKPILERRTPRRYEEYVIPGSLPLPRANGVLVDGAMDRAILRLFEESDSGENQIVFELSTGRVLRDLTLGDSGFEEVHCLPGLPLLLVRSWTAGWMDGIRFGLFDYDGNQGWFSPDQVWSLDRSKDYQKFAKRPWSDNAKSFLSEQGAILSTDGDGAFSLWFESEGVAVDFVAKEVGSKWEVKEVSRKPFTPPPNQFAAPDLPALGLKSLGAVVLGQTKASEFVNGGVLEFGFTPAGDLREVRSANEEGSEFKLTRYSESGEVLSVRNVSLPMSIKAGPSHWIALTDERWLVSHYQYEGRKSFAWTVGELTGEVKEWADVAFAKVEGGVGTEDGGVVLYSYRSINGTSVQAVFRFDRAGKMLWRHPAHHHHWYPDGVTITTSGEVVVVHNVSDELSFHDGLTGRETRRLSLKDLLKQESMYAYGLQADGTGGVLLADGANEPKLWRIAGDGQSYSRVRPKLQNGHASIKFFVNVRVAPDGQLWSTDGYALYRLDERGMVNHTIGEVPRTDELLRVGGLTFDQHGRILIQDAELGNVHVFNAEGQRLFVCVPGPNDFRRVSWNATISVRHDGQIFVENDRDGTYLAFDEQGNRTGKIEFGTSLRFFPNGPGAWAGDAHYDGIGLCNGDLKQTLLVERCFDRSWVSTMPSHFVVLSDGGLAIGSQHGIATFGPDGTPLAVEVLPPRMSLADGALTLRWASMASFDKVAYLYDRLDQSAYRLELSLAPKENISWHMAFSPDEKELWIVEATVPPVLHRYELPNKP